jgi:hypothetical protein
MAPDDENAFDTDHVAEAAAQASLGTDMLALTRVMFGVAVPLAVAPAPQPPTVERMHAAQQPEVGPATAPLAPVPPVAPPVYAAPLPDPPAVGPGAEAVPLPEEVPPTATTHRSPQGPVGIPVPEIPLATTGEAAPAGASSPGGESSPTQAPIDAPPSIPVPQLATEGPDVTQPDEKRHRPQGKHSLELLQEIAFLDE